MAILNYRRFAGPAYLIGWAGVLSVIATELMARHWIPLPRPTATDSHWQSQVAPPVEGSWNLVHVVLSGCPCSERILDHLRARGPIDGVVERIVLVVDSPNMENRSIPGFECDRVTPEQLLARYGVESAPLLLIFNPMGKPRYCGGYTKRKQSFEPGDRQILTDLMAGREVKELPIFGCPVADRLKSSPLIPQIP